MLSETASGFVRWIPLLPLLTGLVHGVTIGLLRRRLSLRAVTAMSISAHAGALLCSIIAFWELISQDDNAPLVDVVGTWIGVGVAPGVFTAEVAFRYDALSATFCLLLTGVGLLVQIFASGFMQADAREDRGFERYFCYSDLFMATMLILILADNLVLLLLGWVGIGVFSYLLIGFWYGDRENVREATRAFVTMSIGDTALLVGSLLVFWSLAGEGAATLRLVEIQAALPILEAGRIALPDWLGGREIGLGSAIALCFFVAACAKIAQLPFLFWLPGAMSAPSPATALVHGACLGAGGVYLLARLSFLYAVTPEVAALVAWTGGLTALFAAGLACVETDIKRVLAYSTATHLGFMMLGIGAGDPTSAVQHAISHAFFQPVLFLGAGLVVSALHYGDLERMGNIGSRIHLTRICMWIALLSSIGVPPFWSGFYSREQILMASYDAVHVPGHGWLYAVALIGSALLAFHVVRLMYLALYGDTRFPPEIRARIDEPESIMLRPIAILAALCVLGCTIGLPQAWADLFPFEVEDSDSIRGFLSTVLVGPGAGPSSSSWEVTGHAVLMTALGALTAAYFYLFRPELPSRIASVLAWPYELAKNRFYLDAFVDRGLIRPILAVSDRVLARWLDTRLIDGVVVDGSARVLERLSDRVLKHWEPGTIQLYLALMLVGVLAVVGWLVLSGGQG